MTTASESFRQIFRFGIVGVINTFLTSLILFGLTYVLQPWLAYAITYAIGLSFAVLASSKWIFESHLSWARVSLFFLGYGIVFVIGLAVIEIIVSLGASHQWSTAVVLVTAPLNFVVGRLVFYRRNLSGN